MTTFSFVIGAALAPVLAGSVLIGVQLSRVPQDLGWIGLYNNRLIEWLENENNLDDRCAQFLGKTYERDRCREEKLLPLPHLVTLRATPSASGRSVGSLLLLATPGQKLQFFYVGPTGGLPLEFAPDLNMQDWGYGPYFHQTYLERRADWFLLPEGPFPPNTWFNARDLGDEPHVLEADGIVDSPKGSLVILAVERDVIRARPEQPADMWCEVGSPPPLLPWTEIRIPRRDLYSRTGHLLISPAYMKGC